ncbi:MAG: hypothetical protein FH758_00730 [Firmicutes bacterium]|nr:hypothetical protein [Bacillota bacterium]
MALHITARQIRLTAVIFVSLLAIWLIMGHFVWTNVNRHGNKIVVDYYFIAPMSTDNAINMFNIVSEVPNDNVVYNPTWVSPFHLKLIIDEHNYPRGVQYSYTFKKAPALIPPFSVSKTGKFLTAVNPELVSLSPTKNAPTSGPIILNFNTPINEESIKENVSCDVNGSLSPLKNDFTKWRFIPEKKLNYQQSYNINIHPGLTSKYGKKSSDKQVVNFTTAPELKLVECYPKNFSRSIWLSRNVKLTFNQPIASATISGKSLGKVHIENNIVTYVPNRVFLPTSNYKLQTNVTSRFGEKYNYTLNFNTTNLGNNKWIEIKAGSPCSVWLMQGKKQQQQVDGWFTKDIDKLPTVTMYETDRGWGTKSAETNEKLPWIKLNTDILIHPTTHTGKDNHKSLGLPKSYSCILLPSAIVDELYYDYPKGIMVIVH